MNQTHRRGILAAILGLAGFLAAGIWLLGPGIPTRAVSPAELPTPQAPARLADGGGQSPNISFIDSPSATCSRPKAGNDACFVEWNYLYVTASTNQYIISMTITLDGDKRAYLSGFFQSYMYIPSNMLAPGFRVACGAPGAGGTPGLGNIYSYTLRARETGGLSAANYGSVACPADIVPLSDLTLSGDENGILGESYTFAASILPVTATLPITYTWTATDYAPVVTTGSVNDAVTFNWISEGDKTVSVTAENGNSSLVASRVIHIRAHYDIYLPLVRR